LLVVCLASVELDELPVPNFQPPDNRLPCFLDSEPIRRNVKEVVPIELFGTSEADGRWVDLELGVLFAEVVVKGMKWAGLGAV